MTHTTYSFADVSLTMSHPAVGSFTFTGEGVGTITVTMANDVTQHDLAADGSVMVSKILAGNGSLALAIQQTSAGHKWLKKWYNYVKVAPTAEWAKASAVLKNPQLGDQITMSGISPQKRADVGFQAAGQQVTWNMMATTING